LRKAHISFVMFVRPSVRIYQPYQHVLARFSLNTTLGTCTKMLICPNLVKIEQNSGNFHGNNVTIYVHHLSRFPANINGNKRAPPAPYLVPVQALILQIGVKCTPTKMVFVLIKSTQTK
jgi:hypothetical protein